MTLVLGCRSSLRRHLGRDQERHMLFDWDEANLSHIAAHDVSQAEVEQVVSNAPFDLGYQDWHEEERLCQIGETASGRILLVVTTLRSARLRVVTSYEPSKALKRFYVAERGRAHGTGAETT